MQLRDYQKDACDAAFDSLKAGRGNPLIDLPTGSGKSLVLAELSRRAVQNYAGRVVVLAHRKELLSQNVAKVRALGLTAGVYSAGLGQRNTEADVVVAGIQSIHKKAHWLGRRHMVLIDEAHLTPKTDDGMYRSFLADLEKYNPRLRIVGLTATPFRLDSGKLWGEGELFSHVCYRGDIRWMIAQGYLCQLVNKPSEYEIDTSKLHTKYGEFVKSEVENLFSQSGHVAASVGELCKLAAGRKSILVFCSGVGHAEVVAEAIQKLTGERVGVVTGDTPPLQRAATLEDFGSGRIRWLCNVDVLTTGFDSPRVDCVATLRATQSAGLFCQIVGRGLRVDPSKQDCLVLDFGGNLKRHGPIDAVDFGNKKPSSGGGERPQKTCPGCGEAVAATVRVCECGFRFADPKPRHEEQADAESQLFSEPKQIKISGWSFNRHVKKSDPDAPNTLRVTYYPEGNLERPVDEWVCLNHEGFALRRALTWWSKHSAENIVEVAEALDMDKVDAAIHMYDRGFVRRPKEITVVQNGKWWRVTDRVDGELEQRVEEVPF